VTDEPLDRSLRDLESEIRSYLAAVDAFRREGCEPSWAPEALDDPCEQLVSGAGDARPERRNV
jgi:hypothetical protein